MSKSLPVPYDPMCNTFARDMRKIDSYLGPNTAKAAALEPGGIAKFREDYIRDEEGTYNPANGHFLCDSCYIAAGQPSSRKGWVCP